MATIRAPSRNGSAGGRVKKSRFGLVDLNRLLFQLVVLAGVFYVGMLVGMSSGAHRAADCPQPAASGVGLGAGGSGVRGGITEDQIESIVQERLQRELLRRNNEKKGGQHPRLSSKTGSFAAGVIRTKAEDFLSTYDYGMASMHSEMRGAEEALILYSKSALPSDGEIARAAINSGGNEPPLMGAADATANCEVMNVVTVHPRMSAMCTVVLSDFESFHIQKWMRAPDPLPMRTTQDSALKRSLPLRHVSRGVQTNGRDQFHAPKDKHIKGNMENLKTYLDSLEDVMAELKPILQKVVQKNTVIVLVCNKGHSDLLMNFACGAKARGLDSSNVLIFATDQHTYDVATGLGLASYFDKKNFGELPTEEARQYGDRVFTKMMYAKVVPVQLINMMGYDVLFQDVDVVWMKNPVEIFHDKSSNLHDFDILFQDDGARAVRFAPYSGNTGFYYVRHNERTKFLLTQLLYNGDMIQSTNSHQQALTALLSEHSSLTGLRVKTLEGKDFPSGFHYHRSKDLMRSIVQGKHEPYLFHMCWTANKDNKILFLKQMGLWYLNEQCTGSEALDTVHEKGPISSCCSAEPLVSCHYRDKPSVIPCKDSPPIDKGKPSFW